jgi:hypothetical protein
MAFAVAANPNEVKIPATRETHTDVNVVLIPPEVGPFRPPSIQGDPHFVGFDGRKFDFHGEANSVFNIISDENMQLNALFVASDRVKKTKTYLGSLGLTVGENQLYVACDREKGERIMKFNGEDLRTNEVLPLDEEGTVMLGEDGKVTIDLVNFFLKVRFSSSAHSSCHINLRASYKPSDDAALPHGILGQTANKNRIIDDVSEPGMNGEGAIEGQWRDYIIASGDLFGSDFKFNRFVGASAEASVSKKRSNSSSSSDNEAHEAGFLHGASH